MAPWRETLRRLLAGAPQFTAYLWDVYGSYDVPDLWLTLFAWIGVGFVVLLPREARSGSHATPPRRHAGSPWRRGGVA